MHVYVMSTLKQIILHEIYDDLRFHLSNIIKVYACQSVDVLPKWDACMFCRMQI